jgi:uncharacterized protein YkwD
MRALYALGITLAVLLPGATRAQAISPLVAHDLLAAHNAARVKVGSPPLVWSAVLAEAAQFWANHLMSTHGFSHQPNDPHGENLFLISGGTVSPTEVVRAWVAEISSYDHNTNTCSGVCGHYTQVIWRTTREVGCGTAFDGYRQVWVCKYEPPGNVVGFRPY